MLKRENENGYTMIETLMYISLLGVIGVVLTHYVNNVFNRYKIGRINQQVLDLKKSILNFTAADEDYSKLSLASMSEAHALPLDLRDGRHAFNEKFEIGPLAPGTVDNPSDEKYLFYITFTNLYRPACVEIISQGQFYRDGADIDTLIVNNQTAWRFEHSFYDTNAITKVHTIATKADTAVSINPPMNEIMDACSDEDHNTITWIFS